MSVDQRSVREARDAVRREQTDEAFKVAEPIENPRVGPRVIPVVIAVVVGIIVILAFFLWPR
jgi:hypothetical protein